MLKLAFQNVRTISWKSALFLLDTFLLYLWLPVWVYTYIINIFK